MWACTRYGSATPSLGWVALVLFGAIYCLIPWIYNRPLHSLKLVDWRFWIATIGIVFNITAMWVSGIMQGLMWRAYAPKAIRLAPVTAALAMSGSSLLVTLNALSVRGGWRAVSRTAV